MNSPTLSAPSLDFQAGVKTGIAFVVEEFRARARFFREQGDEKEADTMEWYAKCVEHWATDNCPCELCN